MSTLDRVFTDNASGRDTARPRLAQLCASTSTGTRSSVHNMDRLARDLDDLRALVQGLTRRGVHVEFVKEHLLFTGEDSPMASLMLSVMPWTTASAVKPSTSTSAQAKPM